METSSRTLWIGCYTSEGGGEGRGVLAVDLATGERRQVDGPPAPSWLVDHPRGVIAVSETDPGRVSLVWDEGGSPRVAGSATTGRAGPCHAALVAPSLLAVAHYTGGAVATVRLDDDGVPAAVVDVADLGGYPLGPHPERQDGSHPHEVVLDDGVLLVPDLGADLVHRLPVDGTGRLGGALEPLRLRPGFGPRHLVVTGDLLLVVGELASEVWVARRAGDGWVECARASTLTEPLDPAASSDPEVGNLPSAIRVAGAEVVVANRGADRVSVLRLDRATGHLALERELPAHGVWPRDLAVAGDDLWVACERSHAVTRVRWRGPDAGALLATVETGSPTSVLLR